VGYPLQKRDNGTMLLQKRSGQRMPSELILAEEAFVSPELDLYISNGDP
jgi:hypothetical protein